MKEGEHFRRAFEDAAIGISLLAVEPLGKYLEVNPTFCRMTGYSREELLARDFQSITASQDLPKNLEQVRTLLSGTIPFLQMEKRYIRKDGSSFWARLHISVVHDSNGKPWYLTVQIEDIDERKRLEEQLRHAHKLEAIGQLAGGVAHEFNNLLTAIIGNLNLATKQTTEGTDLHSILTRAEQAAYQGAVLTQQLLAFGRRSPIDLQPWDLGLIAEEVVRLIRQTIDRRIEVTVDSAKELWPVLTDTDQMHQIIMNLCVNARDALMERLEQDADSQTPLGWQPLIAIKTENIHMDEAYCRFHSDAKPGEHVCLSVSDNGCGIDEVIQHRLFEPFFTTKEVGRGTGLGLPTVYGIVKQHGGWIDLTSAKNEATTFKIYLPRTQRPAAPMAKSHTDEVVAEGTEIILLVDDESSIRRLGQTVLEHHGYTVLLAKDGLEALEIFKRERERIQLVVLDLTMPRQSGQEALRQFLMLNPKLKVIVSSGHRSTSSANPLHDLGSLEFLPKPYRPDELARKVRTLLDRPDHL